MSDGVKFRLDLDQKAASGAVKEFGGTTHAVFTGIDKDIAATQRGLNNLGGEVRLKVDTSAVRKAHEDVAKVNKEMSMLATSGAVFAGSVAAQGVSRAVDFAKDQITDVFSKGMSGGMNQVQFGVMAGEVEGAKLYSDLKKYVNDSIFGTELYDQAAEMKAFGIATAEVLPDMKMLGDVSMGNTQRFQRLAFAFEQTTAAGKLMGQDLNQYIQQGFNPLKEMERTSGTSYNTLRERMEAGQISAKMVRDAFVSATSEGGTFFHMLDKIAETPFGKYQAAMGNIDNAKMELGMAIMPEAAHFLDTMKPLIDELPATLLKLRPSIDGIIKGMGDMVKWTSNNTETLGKWVGTIKLGVEAWAAWKVGTVALTAANWVWQASIGAQVVETTAATVALNEENAAIIAQTAEVEALGIAWATMGTEARAAMLATAGASANLPINMAGAAAAGTSGSAMLAGGLAGAVSKTVIPVAIAYFAGEALSQWMGAGKRGSTFQDQLGYDQYGNMVSWYDMAGKNEAKIRRSQLSRAGYSQEEALAYMRSGTNPMAGAAGIDMSALAGFGISSGTNATLSSKYGVGASTAAPVKLSTESSDTITGGGRQTININFKNFVENLNNNVGSKGEGLTIMEQDMKSMLARLLGGIPS